MKYKEVVTEHLRITVLRCLEESPSRTINESVLMDLLENYGFSPSRDALRTQLHWLEEQGLVTLEGNGCLLASLTARGEDVALCRATVPGVKRPSARS